MKHVECKLLLGMLVFFAAFSTTKIASAYDIVFTRSPAVGHYSVVKLPSSARPIVTGQVAPTWSSISGSTFSFSLSTSGSISMEWGTIDGPGNTTGLYGLMSEDIIFDKTENWYIGTGYPTASQVDFWTIAMHEMGHAAGLNETQTWRCSSPPSTGNPTMCQVWPAGYVFGRSLETDDKNGMDANY